MLKGQGSCLSVDMMINQVYLGIFKQSQLTKILQIKNFEIQTILK